MGRAHFLSIMHVDLVTYDSLLRAAKISIVLCGFFKVPWYTCRVHAHDSTADVEVTNCSLFGHLIVTRLNLSTTYGHITRCKETNQSGTCLTWAQIFLIICKLNYGSMM